MVDYDKASGQGTLRIRDLGSTIEFWVKPYYSDFWWENLDFNWTANGTTTPKQWDFNGNTWQKIGAVTVTTSQTVTFRLLEATNTQSLGGPTTHSVVIDRGTVPPAPDPVVISLVTNTTLRTTFTDNGNGGVALDLWQVARNTSNTLTGAQIISVGSDKLQDWTGLVAGTTQYFWSRVHNAKGYSGWSAVRSVVMHSVPDPPTTPIVSEIEQTSAKVSSSMAEYNGGATVDGKEIGFGLSSAGPQFTITLSGISFTTFTVVITDLNPGEEYFFWARTHNTYGWSDWSNYTLIVLIAGARVKVGAVYKRAVPYVNVAGTWKVAQPWAKLAGIWKKTT